MKSCHRIQAFICFNVHPGVGSRCGATAGVSRPFQHFGLFLPPTASALMKEARKDFIFYSFNPMIREASLSTSCQHIAGGPDAEEKTSVAIRSKFLLLQEGDMEKLHIGVGGNVRQA